MSDFKTSLSYFSNPFVDSMFSDMFDVGLEYRPRNEEKQQDIKAQEKAIQEQKKALEIKKLDIELKKAVVEERYEDAIVLRDKLKELKKEK